MYLTGFADEASQSIDGQIKATLALGWRNIEARSVDGANIHDIPEAAFETVVKKLETAGIAINCFGSAIGNWSKDIRKPFDSCREQAERAVQRMQRTGSKLIRIMSYPMIPDNAPIDQMQEERFRRLRELVSMFKAAGITPVHENCMNYGGMGYAQTLEILENVPGLKLVYDTGNPVHSLDYTTSAPYSMQSSWEFYAKVKEHIAYVHIKDGIWNAAEKKVTYTYPGEGIGDVKRILKDLLASGYDGGLSIEPHMQLVFHDKESKPKEEAMFETYVEYGRRMEKLLKAIQ